MLKKISFTLVTMLILNTIIIPLHSLDGPTQPEAMQFEPVDATDMVSLVTGDLSYVLPLFDVPGSEGNYPISMNYHAGIGLNQEPTWVGLGWTLNPGSINRTLNGYPDDFCGDKVETHYEADELTGVSVGVGLGWGPIGVNMSYDTNSGFGANMVAQISLSEKSPISMSASVGTSGASVGLSYSKGLGMGFKGNLSASLSTSGYSVGASASRGIGGIASGNVSANYGSGGFSSSAGMSMSGFSLSTSSAGGSSFSFAGVGLSTAASMNGSGKFSSSSISIPIPLPGSFWASLSYSSWKWKLDETYTENSYGYLHQYKYHNAPSGNSTLGARYERQLQGDYIYSSQDLYMVSAQGISGTMMPFTNDAYLMYDGEENDEKGYLYNSESNFGPFLENNTTQFRFLDDLGCNYITNDIAQNSSQWGNIYNQYLNDRISGKEIIPHFNNQTNKINGFTIIDIDGKVYEFMRPVRNTFQYSHSVNDSSNLTSYNRLSTPYAINWLITAIKGPDYYDYDKDSDCSDEDWGFWVKFNYTKESNPLIWRSPATDGETGPGSSSDDVSTYSTGVRDILVLNSIETNTHFAEFISTDSKNRYSVSDLPNIREPTHSWIYNSTSDLLEVYLYGNYEDAINSLDSNDIVVKATILYDGGLEKWYSEIAGNIVYCDYDDNLDKTYVIFDDSEIEPSIQVSTGQGENDYITMYFEEVLDVQLYVDNVLNSSTDYACAKVLDEIKLYNKKYLDRYIKKVSLSYDYSLCPYTPNSVSTISDGAIQGKLALKKATFYGLEDISGNNLPIIPPYYFEYGNADAPGTDLNPSYSINNWDRWGSYRDPGYSTDNGKYVHMTPQDQSRADKKAAWSLSKITTPTGGTISIEYEADSYIGVQDKMDFNHVGDINLDNSNYVENTVTSITLSSVPQEIVEGLKIFVGYHYERYENNITVENYNALSEPLTVTSINGSTNTISFSPAYTFEVSGGDQEGNGETYEYTLFYRENVLGGQIRVKSISLSNGLNQYKTRYIYNDDNGLSTGYTASLPSQYRDFTMGFVDDLQEDDAYRMLYMDHELSAKGPSPSVMYSQVEVLKVDPVTDEPLEGKTRYEFYTSRDYPFDIDKNGTIISIDDRTGIYGRPKATTYFEQINNGALIDFRPVQKDSFRYVFSTDLLGNGNEINPSVIVKDNNGYQLNHNTPLGLMQEKFAFENEATTDGMIFVDRNLQNIYSLGSKSELFVYDGLYDKSIISHTVNFIVDAISGQFTGTATFNSKKEAVITETTPAYYNYNVGFINNIYDKNMLTQSCLSEVFKTDLLLPLDESQINESLVSHSYSSNDLISAEVIKWADFSSNGNGIWRQNDKYRFIGDSSEYEEFSSWRGDSGNFIANSSGSNIWKRTSNISEYDNYGHPIEEIAFDGNLTTAIYGTETDLSLPIAIAINASNDQVNYYNFEDVIINTQTEIINNGPDVVTGIGAGSYNSSGVINDYVVSTPNIPTTSGKYHVSYWKKNNSDSEWTFVSDEINANTQIIVSTSESGLIDDIRVHPPECMMTTYTYDPLTRSLTSITDENNVSSYFDYDNAGRLVTVRDRNKNILKIHNYRYKGMRY